MEERKCRFKNNQTRNKDVGSSETRNEAEWQQAEDSLQKECVGVEKMEHEKEDRRTQRKRG